jgi:hypothetical protein
MPLRKASKATCYKKHAEADPAKHHLQSCVKNFFKY